MRMCEAQREREQERNSSSFVSCVVVCHRVASLELTWPVRLHLHAQLDSQRRAHLSRQRSHRLRVVRNRPVNPSRAPVRSDPPPIHSLLDCLLQLRHRFHLLRRSSLCLPVSRMVCPSFVPSRPVSVVAGHSQRRMRLDRANRRRTRHYQQQHSERREWRAWDRNTQYRHHLNTRKKKSKGTKHEYLIVQSYARCFVASVVAVLLLLLFLTIILSIIISQVDILIHIFILLRCIPTIRKLFLKHLYELFTPIPNEEGR